MKKQSNFRQNTKSLNLILSDKTIQMYKEHTHCSRLMVHRFRLDMGNNSRRIEVQMILLDK